MKKIKYLLLVLLVGVIFTGCGKNNLKTVSFNELNKKLENGESFFFEVVQDGCSHCANFTPKLKEVLNEYDVIGYQLNLTDLTEENYKTFNSMFDVDGTPTTIFIVNGKEVSLLQRIDGDVSKEKIISKLKTNKYINE